MSLTRDDVRYAVQCYMTSRHPQPDLPTMLLALSVYESRLGTGHSETVGLAIALACGQSGQAAKGRAVLSRIVECNGQTDGSRLEQLLAVATARDLLLRQQEWESAVSIQREGCRTTDSGFGLGA